MMRKSLVFWALLGILPAALPLRAEEAAVSAHPDGTGDRDATTCRPPQSIPGSRMSGPRVCKLNSQWALLRKNGQDISADGRDIVPDAKAGGLAPMNCTMVGGGATNGGGQMNCHTQ